MGEKDVLTNCLQDLLAINQRLNSDSVMSVDLHDVDRAVTHLYRAVERFPSRARGHAEVAAELVDLIQRFEAGDDALFTHLLRRLTSQDLFDGLNYRVHEALRAVAKQFPHAFAILLPTQDHILFRAITNLYRDTPWLGEVVHAHEELILHRALTGKEGFAALSLLFHLPDVILKHLRALLLLGYVQPIAGGLLRTLGNTRAVEAVVPLLSDPDAALREHAITLLGLWSERMRPGPYYLPVSRRLSTMGAWKTLQDAAPRIADLAKHDPDPVLRLEAGKVIASLWPSDWSSAMTVLKSELRNPGWWEFVAVLCVVRNIADVAPLLPELKIYLSLQEDQTGAPHQHLRCRRLLMRALPRMGTDAQSLAPVLVDRAKTARGVQERRDAVLALAAVAPNNEEAFRACVELTRWRRRPKIRHAAIQALARFRHPEVLSLLLCELANQDDVMSRMAYIGLHRWLPLPPGCLLLLKESCDDPRPSVSRRASALLRYIHPTERSSAHAFLSRLNPSTDPAVNHTRALSLRSLE